MECQGHGFPGNPGCEGSRFHFHFWHKPEDTISWLWTTAAPGRYRVELHYSLVHTMQGGTISLKVGDQRLVVPAKPSGKWTDFRTFKLGVMGVEKGGDLPVVLQAAQLPSLPNAALPDVAWLSLTPTNAPVTPASESQASENIELETLPTVAAGSGVISFYYRPSKEDIEKQSDQVEKVLHFRDVDKRASDGKDVTLGDGAAQIQEMLVYMKQKGVKPILVFEYERDQDKPLKYIVPSLEFLEKASSDLK